MIHSIVGRLGVEMTDDPTFRGRVRRLAVVSAVALGLVWFLGATTLDAHTAIDGALLLGWVSMPAMLGLSLRRPRVRRLIALPSVVVGAALLAACLTALPDADPARTGWLMLTAGILAGALLGAWFWYRWLPVPRSLDDPFSAGRWTLIGVHTALVVAGLALIVLAEVG